MTSLYPPFLTGTDLQTKRQEIKNYFLNTYEIFEKIFEVLKNDDVFYKKSELARHPMIFYFGHTATFFINKLILMNVIDTRVNPEFESIFAIGVDEMNWDDVDSKNYIWPSVDAVKKYRNIVKKLILNLIESIDFSLPIKGDDAMWIILMGIEHERIHIETSLVLHRQMPLKFIQEIEEFNVLEDSNEVINNELIEINRSTIILGKDKTHNLYGWDNEYGEYKEDVQTFQTSKYLVSNKEFMEFVQNDGYQIPEYWDEEGQNFLKNTNATHPTFWLLENGVYKYRALCKIIEMPLNFPVDVNALEAAAFCRYKSKKDGITYSLPSEAEHAAMYKQSGVKEFHHLEKEDANLNLLSFSSSSVNKHNFNGIYDIVGNSWQWSSTAIFGFDGFEVHDAYDDFSTPTFDNKHALVLGSSWASSGNLIMKHSRYAFRKHFYQNAGFRYVVSNKNTLKKHTNSYEDDVTKNCLENYLQNNDYSYIPQAMKYLSGTKKALDFGCKSGRSSFELARYFNKVDGVDISARFIRVGVNFKENGFLQCNDKTLSLQEFGYERVKNQVSFKQANPNNLKPNFNGYDFVVAKVNDTKSFLNNIQSRINHGAIIVVFDNTNHEDFTVLQTQKNFSILQKI